MTSLFAYPVRLVLPAVAVAICLMGAMPPSYAAVDMCDPKVRKLQETRAQAKVCAEKAVVEQMMDKPDSVLAMTCFNKSAGVSSQEGGKIFSGSFIKELKRVIEPALKTWYGDGTTQNPGNFAGAEGEETGTVNYGSNASKVEDTDNAECDAIDKLWEKNEETGINLKAPYITDVDLRNDTPPKCRAGDGSEADCGDDFKDAWKACADQGLFKAYKTAYEALNPPAIPDFSTATSSCDVMQAAGLSAGSCQ